MLAGLANRRSDRTVPRASPCPALVLIADAECLGEEGPRGLQIDDNVDLNEEFLRPSSKISSVPVRGANAGQYRMSLLTF